jgi:hypothetical protein
MVYTLNQLNAKIKEFADAHLQLKGSYSLGELEEVTNQGAVQFPFMYAILEPSNFSNRNVSITISFIVMDLVHKDLSDRVEVWSDTLQIISDLKAFLFKSEHDDLFTIDEEIPIISFADRFTDDVTGWTADITFRINDLKDSCAIPQ